MRGGFEEEDFDRGRQRRDTELTLGSTTLLGIFFGMVLLCGLFFALGFAVGRYGPSDSPLVSRQAATAPSSAIVASAKAKPSATGQIAPQPQPAAVSVPVVPSSVQPGPAAPGTPFSAQAGVVSAPASPYGQPQVKPALPTAQYPAPAPAAQPPALGPAPGPAAGLMVQIAAVMRPEDAEVLVEALRKRGYPVSVRRLPTDSLIHVQIGPFNSQNQANRWKQKLLNDGYNAILMP